MTYNVVVVRTAESVYPRVMRRVDMGAVEAGLKSVLACAVEGLEGN